MSDVSFSGPLFDGSAQPVLDEMVHQIQESIAQEAFETWNSYMDEHFRVNHRVYTGFTQVRDDGDDTVVNDGWSENNDLPYGLWLEGIGSRNAPVTIFEGYHSLRDAYETTEAGVQDIAAPVVEQYVAQLNGQ